MNYMGTVNHPNFRLASCMVWTIRKLLENMGMSHEEAFGWIKAWASGAGDGSE